MNTAIVKKGNINDAYIIGAIVGRGGFSIVRKVKNKHTGEEFALKIVEEKAVEEDEEILCNEIEILSKLDHPNIIKLHEVWLWKGKLLLVMDLMRGGELFSRIDKTNGVSEQEAARILHSVVETTAYCHSLHIVHRDLKPENILYKTSEPDSPLMISDFGLSRICDGASMSTDCGTLPYTAPEVLAGLGYDHAVDIWSIGVTLYQLLSEDLPFYDENKEELHKKIKVGEYDFPSPRWDNISDDAKDLIRKMLTVKVEMRIGLQEILSHPWMVANLHSNDAEYIPVANTEERRPERREE